MPIFIGSRYEFDPVYSLDCPRGADHQHLTVFSNTDNANRGNADLPHRTHVVVAGERLDELAYRYYGSAERWWYIADANKDVVSDPMAMSDPVSLTPGSQLRIPNASG